MYRPWGLGEPLGEVWTLLVTFHFQFNPQHGSAKAPSSASETDQAVYYMLCMKNVTMLVDLCRASTYMSIVGWWCYFFLSFTFTIKVISLRKHPILFYHWICNSAQLLYCFSFWPNGAPLLDPAGNFIPQTLWFPPMTPRYFCSNPAPTS